jgi:hypothetical protein
VSGERLLSIGSGIGFSIGGFLLTMIWYCSTKKTWGYVRYWWESVQKAEEGLALHPFDFAKQLESEQDRGQSVRYRNLVVWIPLLFSLVWVALFILAVARFACFVHCFVR